VIMYYELCSHAAGPTAVMYTFSENKKTQLFIPFLCQCVQLGDHRIIQTKA